MRVALFPGQGVKASLVLEALDPTDPTVSQANEILGSDLRKQVEVGMRGQRKELPTLVAQPAIFVASVAALRRAEEAGGAFDAAAGHSLGEYAALVAGGSISFEHALYTVRVRAEAMHRACPPGEGGMAAVLGLDIDVVERLAASADVTVANDNAPGQVVVSGATDALTRLGQLVTDAGGRCTLLGVSGAFHSDSVAAARPRLLDVLEHVWIRSPEIPVVSNISARPYRAPGEIRALLVEQLTSRVRYRESLLWLAEQGATHFDDLGPGRVVAGLAKRTLGTEDREAIVA